MEGLSTSVDASFSPHNISFLVQPPAPCCSPITWLLILGGEGWHYCPSLLFCQMQKGHIGRKQSKCEMRVEKMRSACSICGQAEYPIYLQPAYRQQPRNGCGGISGVRGFCLPTRKNLILSAASLSMKLTGANGIAFTLLVTRKWNQS